MKTYLYNVVYINKNKKFEFMKDMKITQNLITQNKERYFKINSEFLNVIINFYIRNFEDKKSFSFEFTKEEMKFYTQISNLKVINYIYNNLFNENEIWNLIEKTENGYSFVSPFDFNYEIINKIIKIIDEMKLNLSEFEEYMLSSIFYQKDYKEIVFKKLSLN